MNGGLRSTGFVRLVEYFAWIFGRGGDGCDGCMSIGESVTGYDIRDSMSMSYECICYHLIR